ncbi:MAG TPA: SpoIIE family protein phosphatase [Chloroflexia bacterium]|nr:SpoIIE family protein phosphatase [Chloroflexia bacterium]
MSLHTERAEIHNSTTSNNKANPGTIMIVDDLPDNLTLLNAILVAKGFNVIQASSGPKALALLDQTQPDVIFLDIMMPEMDGFEVTRRIRQREDLPYIPIVLLTALQDNKSKLLGLDAGADDFLSKPFSQPELLARAHSLVRLRRYNQALSQVAEENRYLNDLLLVENSRMALELERTREAQMRLMPDSGPQYPGVTFSAFYKPALEVGGDYYDYLMLDEGRFVVLLGDAVGKGGAAVLSVAIIKSVVSTEFQHIVETSSQNFNPAQLLERVNSIICGPLSTSQTEMTLFCGLVDLNKRSLTYSNAGQTFPYLARKGGLIELKLSGLPIGLFNEAEYSACEIEIKPEDLLLLYSDGINEAMNLHNEQFGLARLEAAILQHAGKSAQGLLDGVLYDLNQFCQDASDDQSVVVIGF